MTNYFVPYSGDKPASLMINGHKLVILCLDPRGLEDQLELVGADRLQRFTAGDTPEAQEKALANLARDINAGVVVAPADVDVQDVIRNLETQLPWVQ